MSEKLRIRSTTLASMLAQENLTVEFVEQTATAYFDQRTRRLVLPMWDLKNQTLVDMLVEHEVGHALYSEGMDLGEVEADLRPYVNILEDVRVDRLQREAYPGTKKDYFEAGKALIALDVFKLKDMDMSEALLIDRINLKSKVGFHVGLPFYTETEREFVKRAFTTKTPEEVLALAREIFEYEKEEREQKEEEWEKQRQAGGEPQDGGSDAEEPSEGAPGNMKEAGSEKKSSAKAGENAEPENAGEKDSQEAGEKDGEEEFSQGESGKKSESKDGADTSNNTSGGKSCQSKPKADTKPQTASSIDDYVREQNAKSGWDNRYRKNYYLEIGDVDVKRALADPVLFREEVKKWSSSAEIEDIVPAKEAKYKGVVAGLQKEFSIFRQARSTSMLRSCKGSIDTNALHLYRINDNIFRKEIVTERNTENHRIVFLLDNSGSMYSNNGLITVLDQLIIFRRFCLNEGIPFHVFTFTSMQYFITPTPLVEEYMKRGVPTDEECKANHRSACRQYEPAMLIEVLTEKDSNDYFNKLVNMLLKSWHNLTSLHPGMTPTNEALSRLYRWFIEVKRTMPEDKLNLIILTDGDSTDATDSSVIVRDMYTKKEYTATDVFGDLVDTKFCPGFVVLKALKEQKILHSVIWYNYVAFAKNIGRFDFGSRVLEKIAAGLLKMKVDYRKSKKEVVRKINNDGVLAVENIFPFIDCVYYFTNPQWIEYTNTSGRAASNTAEAEFKREMKVKRIFKTLSANVAKFLG